MSMTLPAPRVRRRPTLARYDGPDGRPHKVVALPGTAGTTLVVDRVDGMSGDDADERLVAHLAADEPSANAEVVAAEYVADLGRRLCPLARPLCPDDLEHAPFSAVATRDDDAVPDAPCLCGRGGVRYVLAPVRSPTMTIPELRWQCLDPRDADGATVVSVRDVIGALEDYEPARSLSVRAIAAQRGDERVSVAALRGELARLASSRIVLNRRLREAVLATVARDGLSMSEIALRCERVKRDARGNESGETSWLARRLGLQAEGGEAAATPWIHSDVLALIARHGLGLCPLEVEL